NLPESLAPWQAELPDPTCLLIRYRPSETKLGEILGAMNQAGIAIGDLSTEETDLQDIFLQLTRADNDQPT
ncbi:MAG: ABC transporter ATP-binding protein, partial [Pseudomonadota bacterium]